MSTFNGLPTHVLLVHFIVVLGPLTAVLAIVCTLWPPARQRLAWLVLALGGDYGSSHTINDGRRRMAGETQRAVATVGCPHRIGRHDGVLLARVVAAAALIAFVHVREARGRSVKPVARRLIAAIVVVASVATAVQVYRIGDSGAKATWSRMSAVGSSTP